LADLFRKTHRTLSEQEQALLDSIKRDALELYSYLAQIYAGREKAIAITKLEECVMWAVKGITA
jgi:hypothetical protein